MSNQDQCGAKGTDSPSPSRTYQELREQWQRLTQQRAVIDGKLALLSQVLSLFE